MKAILRTSTLLLLLTLFMGAAGAQGPDPVIAEQRSRGDLSWRPQMEWAQARLRIGDRHGLVREVRFEAGEELFLQTASFEDGLYRYELRAYSGEVGRLFRACRPPGRSVATLGCS